VNEKLFEQVLIETKIDPNKINPVPSIPPLYNPPSQKQPEYTKKKKNSPPATLNGKTFAEILQDVLKNNE
jgi:hypothetical protein